MALAGVRGVFIVFSRFAMTSPILVTDATTLRASSASLRVRFKPALRQARAYPSVQNVQSRMILSHMLTRHV